MRTAKEQRRERKKKTPEQKNALPGHLDIVFKCPKKGCGCRLVRSTTSWLCPWGHTKMIGDRDMAERVERANERSGLRRVIKAREAMRRARWWQRNTPGW